MMGVLGELKAQRARIAGPGFRWIKSSPFGRPGTCCTIAWTPRDSERMHELSMYATALLNAEVKERHGDDWDAVDWNDKPRGATRKEVLDIFDTVIAQREARR